MTDIDEIRLGEWDDDVPPPADEDQDTPLWRRRRREIGPKANPFWRFVFPVLVALAGLAVALLSADGARRVLDSTDGTIVELVTDPDAAGYEVFVEPTPTMLVAHIDGDELVGVTVLARTRLDNGGSVVLVDPFLRVLDPATSQTRTLRTIYAEDGVSGLERVVSSTFGFGFAEVDEIATARLGAWMAEVEPIPFRAVDDLIQLDTDGAPVVWLDQGSKQLDGEVAAEVYSVSNPGEVSANRTERQVDLWRSWITEIERADDVVAATLPFDDGLSVHLRSLAQSADVQVLAADPVTFGGADTEYELSEHQEVTLEALARRMVPLPISPPADGWPAVRLLDGTGNTATRDQALRALAHRGIEIAVVGNADKFGVTETVVSYHRPEDEVAAEAVASSLGASVAFVAEPDQLIVLTITIGSDWEPA